MRLRFDPKFITNGVTGRVPSVQNSPGASACRVAFPEAFRAALLSVGRRALLFPSSDSNDGVRLRPRPLQRLEQLLPSVEHSLSIFSWPSARSCCFTRLASSGFQPGFVSVTLCLFAHASICGTMGEPGLNSSPNGTFAARCHLSRCLMMIRRKDVFDLRVGHTASKGPDFQHEVRFARVEVLAQRRDPRCRCRTGRRARPRPGHPGCSTQPGRPWCRRPAETPVPVQASADLRRSTDS